MNPEVEPTWASHDRPVLAAAVAYIEQHQYRQLPQAYDLAPLVGLDAEEAGVSLLRLDGEYIEVSRTMGGHAHTMVSKVLPAGRRAVGQWPSAEQLAGELVTKLQEAAEAEPNEEKRGKLRQAASFFGEAGRDLLVDVVGAVITRQAGL